MIKKKEEQTLGLKKANYVVFEVCRYNNYDLIIYVVITEWILRYEFIDDGKYWPLHIIIIQSETYWREKKRRILIPSLIHILI